MDAPQKKPVVVAVIPAYNEESKISKVVEKVSGYVDHVIVIDDGSNDETFSKAKSAGAVVKRLEENQGYGFAIREGIDYAIDLFDCPFVVLIDGDGQHPAYRIPELVSKLREDYDIVFTARGFSGQMPALKRVGNFFLTSAINIVTGMHLHDSQSGFRAFNSKSFKKMDLTKNRYEFGSEIILETKNKSLKYCEMPIETIYHKKEGGTTLMDGIKIFFHVLSLKINKSLHKPKLRS